MKVSVEKPGSPGDILEHVGVKGMKWGVRKAVDTAIGTKTAGRKPSSYKKSKGPSSVSRAGSAVARTAARAGRRVGRAIDDAIFIAGSQSSRVQEQIAAEATSKLVKSLPSIKARHGDYAKLSNRIKRPFSKEAKAYRADVKKTYLKHLESSANAFTNTRGTLRYTLKENGQPNTSSYFWNVAVEQVEHVAAREIKVRPIFDDEGWIVDFEIIDDEMEQTMDRGVDFLIHMGIKV